MQQHIHKVGVVSTEKGKDEIEASRNAANIRLAVILGLVAVGFYFGFIWFYFK